MIAYARGQIAPEYATKALHVTAALITRPDLIHTSTEERRAGGSIAAPISQAAFATTLRLASVGLGRDR